MQVPDRLISQLPRKIENFIQNLKHAGFNTNRVFTISKEILEDINGYYSIEVITEHTCRKWRARRLMTAIN